MPDKIAPKHLDHSPKRMDKKSQKIPKMPPKLAQRLGLLIKEISKITSDREPLSFRGHRTDGRIEYVEIQLALFPDDDD